jgi:hypothetical protein
MAKDILVRKRTKRFQTSEDITPENIETVMRDNDVQIETINKNFQRLRSDLDKIKFRRNHPVSVNGADLASLTRSVERMAEVINTMIDDINNSPMVKEK